MSTCLARGSVRSCANQLRQDGYFVSGIKSLFVVDRPAICFYNVIPLAHKKTSLVPNRASWLWSTLKLSIIDPKTRLDLISGIRPQQFGRVERVLKARLGHRRWSNIYLQGRNISLIAVAEFEFNVQVDTYRYAYGRVDG